jgi:hypothetical protein
VKKISVFIALLALLFTEAALAAGAVVTSATGTVQVQTGSAAPRMLRQGDEVAQGDTIITGAASSVVLKFDDGQVAALTSNSRLQISQYAYNPANESGNVLLSLVSGGMRAITGLIGRRAPSQVAYRAATATIGIRGTDTTIATADGNVVVTVAEGSITFSFGGTTFTIGAGEAVLARPGQTPVRGTVASILSQAPAAIQAAVNQFQALNGPINATNPGQPRAGSTESTSTTTIQGGQSGGAQVGGGSGGGGNSSGS